MPKSIVIEPARVFTREVIRFADIPVNAYDKTLGRGACRVLARTTCCTSGRTCAAFVSSRPALRRSKQGRLQGHHLHARRSRAPVDRTGSGGRRHGVFADARRSHLRIASQPRRDSGQGLLGDPAPGRWTSAGDHGDLSRRRAAAARRDGASTGSVKDLARRFFAYGAYSEIFARETGFNRGLGGSMHAFFTPFGIYPNNAIVGGSGSIAPERRSSSVSTAGPASSSPTSATRRSAAARSGKASRFRPWISSAPCGTPLSAAGCRSSSTA